MKKVLLFQAFTDRRLLPSPSGALLKSSLRSSTPNSQRRRTLGDKLFSLGRLSEEHVLAVELLVDAFLSHLENKTPDTSNGTDGS